MWGRRKPTPLARPIPEPPVACVPTARELRNIEQAAAVLTALASMLSSDTTTGYPAQLLSEAESLIRLAHRQPAASRSEFFAVAVQEHAGELHRYLTRKPTR